MTCMFRHIEQMLKHLHVLPFNVKLPFMSLDIHLSDNGFINLD